MGKKRKKQRRRLTEEATYVCDACGEEVEIPVDLSAGESQEYVEDCPVCCRPITMQLNVGDDGESTALGATRDD